VIELPVTHTVYLVWLHLKLYEQVLALLSRDVLFDNSEATRAPNTDIPVIFLSLAFCRRQKVESQIYFHFAYVMFAKILIKIMHVFIVHIYIYIYIYIYIL
jgi:hypothetical protein